ncbi:CFI-box-CTERM domain-containing protein [Nitrosopumilus sp.]|uniref:CFI-box-CTERM domain-containing protein n=1 Tax=Nitrosopumilus sp. TaxID=2024843 RepID=UPI00292CDA1A|nr:CFI-box-CTERM domain-containing protein [Nitrosopumilus sp.]
MIVEIGEKATEKRTIIGVEKNSEGLNEINEKGGGCLIAAAAYGTELAPQVQFLREIRDNTLMSISFGATFVTGFNQIYYSFSSSVANLERENEIFKDKVRFAIT